MNVYRRNILVGTVVLAAGSVFVWMILEFSSKMGEVLAPPQMTIHFDSDRADGLADGSEIDFLGVAVGRVVSLKRKNGLGVSIVAALDRTPTLPANLTGEIVQRNLIGGGTVLDLRLVGKTPDGELKPDATLDAKYVGLQFNVIPPDVGAAAGDIGDMAREARKTLQQLNESGVVHDLDNTIKQVDAQLSKAGDTISAVQQLVSDPQMQQNIKETIANIHTASTKLDGLADSLEKDSKDIDSTVVDAHKDLDDLTLKLSDRLTQFSAVLGNVQSITAKVDQGKGTAGQLVNDPKLYESMVDSMKQLNESATDLHRLIDQWEQEGVTLHLK